MLLGATFRAIGLSVQSLWLDEGATWWNATLPTLRDTVLAESNHPPLWWVVTRFWIRLFGDSEQALRAPAALLGIASIWLAWILGLRLFDPDHAPSRGGFDRTPDDGRGRRMAGWFAALVAGSSYFVEYAQEARMYSALIAETLGLSILYLRWLDVGGEGRRGRGTLVGYAALAAAALYTHYFALWPILAHGAHALGLAVRTRRSERPVRALPMALAIGAAGLLFVPWFLYFATHPERIATGRAYEPFGRLLYVVWRMGAGPGLVVVDRARLAEGVSATLAEEWPIVLGVAVLWFVPVVLGAFGLRRLRGTASFVAANLLVPIVLVLAVFPWFPLVHERYLCFLAPWVLALAVVGACRARGVLGPLLLGGLVLLSMTGLAAYFGPSPRYVGEGAATKIGDDALPRAYVPDPSDPLTFLHHGHPYGKEPWRVAHRRVAELARPGDVVFLHPAYLHLVWDYYDRGKIETLRLPEHEPSPGEIREKYGDLLRGKKRVFLVLAHEETADPDAWFVAMRAALGVIWAEEGAPSLLAIPPVEFRRSWGVRFAVFDRP
jgi:hypothetical protein